MLSPRGGAGKNRLAEETVELPAGSYSLCYATDDSHAYGDWNQEPPYNPSRWGISLFEIDGAGQIHRGENPELNVTGISLAPVGNDEHQYKRFETSERTRVRVVALGEGVEGRWPTMAGWSAPPPARCSGRCAIRTPGGRAGGARKNREERVVLELPPDVYELHYVSDGSHAFGGWNDDPPFQPHLWGITLIEQK